MYQAHRFMRWHHYNPNDTADTLRLFLSNAPWVIRVGEIESHRQGGFRAGFDLDNEYLDSFIAELERNDWMSVVYGFGPGPAKSSAPSAVEYNPAEIGQKRPPVDLPPLHRTQYQI